MSSSRRAARILAMQALCQWDVQRDADTAKLREFLQEWQDEAGQSGADSYAFELVQYFWTHATEIDAVIQGVSSEWTLERMALVDRNLLRVAVVELRQGAVPPRVAINEALELAHEYAGKGSPRFINGVLDAVARQLAHFQELGEHDTTDDNTPFI